MDNRGLKPPLKLNTRSGPQYSTPPSSRTMAVVARTCAPSNSCPASPVLVAPPQLPLGPVWRHLETEGRIRVVTKMRHDAGVTDHMKGLTLEPQEHGVQLTIDDTWPKKCYHLDAFYDPDQKSSEVFRREVEPLLGHVTIGYNATIFVYGPTGSGKTYLMQGNGEEAGLIPQTASFLLSGSYDIGVKMSCYELYCDKVVDLHSGETLKILESSDGTECISGLTQKKISSFQEFEEAFSAAMQRRQTAFTQLNATSSRSHAILELTCWDSQWKHELGKLRMLDLAGTENNSHTGNKEKRMQESCSINESLFYLSRVIEQLGDSQKSEQGKQPDFSRTQMKKPKHQDKNQAHIGYRACKLTRVLKDTLGGESHAVMIACLKPHDLADTQRVLSLAAKSRQIQKPLDTPGKAKQSITDIAAAGKARKESLMTWKSQQASMRAFTGATNNAQVKAVMLSPEATTAPKAGQAVSVPKSLSKIISGTTQGAARSQRKLAFGSVLTGESSQQKTDRNSRHVPKWVNVGDAHHPRWIKQESIPPADGLKPKLAPRAASSLELSKLLQPKPEPVGNEMAVCHKAEDPLSKGSASTGGRTPDSKGVMGESSGAAKSPVTGGGHIDGSGSDGHEAIAQAPEKLPGTPVQHSLSTSGQSSLDSDRAVATTTAGEGVISENTPTMSLKGGGDVLTSQSPSSTITGGVAQSCPRPLALRESSPNLMNTTIEQLQGLTLTKSSAGVASGRTPRSGVYRLFEKWAEDEIINDLNNAPEDKLISNFKGIGKVRAAKITSQRSHATPEQPTFQKIDDLRSIGMTPKQIQALQRDFLARRHDEDEEDTVDSAKMRVMDLGDMRHHA